MLLRLLSFPIVFLAVHVAHVHAHASASAAHSESVSVSVSGVTVTPSAPVPAPVPAVASSASSAPSSASAPASASASISVPLSPPSSAPTLDPALLSFSLEQDRWPDWASGSSASNASGTPNAFFSAALQNLATRTGVQPVIRIGANSEDHTDFSESVQISETIFPASSSATPYPEASNITVGQGFYNLVSHLPSNTKVVWGVNLGSDNLTAATLEAKALKEAFEGSEVRGRGLELEFVEIGNEPDLYGGNGHRNSSWNVQEYVQQWTEFAAEVGPDAGVSNTSASNAPKFWGCAFGHSTLKDSGFSPESAFSNGLLDSAEGQLITAISQHNYMGSGATGTLGDLMSKSAIRGNVSQFDNDIAAVHAKGLDYIMGETNSFFNHGAPNASDVAGAALWALDYTLFAGVSGIRRMHFHEGIGYKYNMIQPVTLTHSPDDNSVLNPPLAPHYQPAYYGALVVADTVGTSGAPRIVELDVSGTSTVEGEVAGYAVFDAGKETVSRVLLINFRQFLSTSGGEGRGSVNVTLDFGGSGEGPEEAEVKVLQIPFADTKTGITWAGQSFDTPSGEPSGAVKTSKLVGVPAVKSSTSASGGGCVFYVEVEDTQAVLLSFS